MRGLEGAFPGGPKPTRGGSSRSRSQMTLRRPSRPIRMRPRGCAVLGMALSLHVVRPEIDRSFGGCRNVEAGSSMGGGCDGSATCNRGAPAVLVRPTCDNADAVAAPCRQIVIRPCSYISSLSCVCTQLTTMSYRVLAYRPRYAYARLCMPAREYLLPTAIHDGLQ